MSDISDTILPEPNDSSTPSDKNLLDKKTELEIQKLEKENSKLESETEKLQGKN
jgi:hypothetical protein